MGRIAVKLIGSVPKGTKPQKPKAKKPKKGK